MPYTYKYARPALTVDCVVFGVDDEDLKVLLIRRANPPFANAWALPGGVVEVDETADDAARRELEEETSLKRVFLEQLYTFSDVDRDPRERVVSIAYFALVRLGDHRLQAATDAADANWFCADKPPRLAFDHRKILRVARERLRAKVRYQPIGFELLPRKFSLRRLQHLYETVLGREMDKRNFRKKILSLEVLSPLDEVEQGVAHRAAKLYRFDKAKYEKLTKLGILFEV